MSKKKIRKRFYVSDIDYRLLKENFKHKQVIDIFGWYFNKEEKADQFIKENPDNVKYIIETEGRKVISLKECE